MYEEYAKDPRMKLNLGIRRRLAPLLDNGRDEIQLMHAILFSLPGSPVLYYGDEIGMGDNIFLGDRDGVRTPMQWTGDRNGGHSRADFAQLYLPPLMDPVYGFQAVNVEAQLRNPNSLLRWIHPLISLRKDHRSSGSALTRRCGPTTRASSRTSAVRGRHRPLRSQPGALRAGRPARPLALGGDGPGGDARPHAFPGDRRAAVPPDARAARLLLVPAPEGRGIERRPRARRLRHRAALVRLEVARRRRRDHRRLRDVAAGGARCSSCCWSRSGSTPARTRRIRWSPRASSTRSRTRRACPSSAPDPPGHAARGARGHVRARAGRARARGLPGRSPTSVQLVATEQSNSSVVFDESLILKVFRRVEPGVNPELELLRFLTDHGFEHIAPLAGWYAYTGEPMDATLGMCSGSSAGGDRRLGARARHARRACGVVPRRATAPG